jgi:signal transduction histidine kinase
MATSERRPALVPKPGRGIIRARARADLDALEHLVSGLGTAVLALIMLAWLIFVLLLCTVGAGLLLLRTVPPAVRVAADRERARLSRWNPGIIGLGPAPQVRLRTALADRGVQRELHWLLVHGTLGLAVGLVAATTITNALQDVTYPLWWRLVPHDGAHPMLVFWDVRNESDALLVTLLGAGLGVLFLVLGPALARAQAFPGLRLLAASPDRDLSLRVAELSATRAAALDAHATELRRIERSLHDGAQNRLVAVTVLLGAARRSLARDPAGAEVMLERVQAAAEQALAELRTVVRGILPPVLADRGLVGAIDGLAANCGVPCRVEADLPGRCAASVEASVYFVTAEALTNVARHSRARSAAVAMRRHGDRLTLRIEDDGVGGADERAGSGIAGMRGRIEAHDGRLSLTSPLGGPTILHVELPCGL